MTYNDTAFIATFPQLQNNAEIISLLDACVYPNANGEILNALSSGGSQLSFNKTTSLFTTIDSFNNFTSTYGAITEPVSMTYYKNLLTEGRNFGNDTVNDFATSDENLNYNVALDSLNTKVECSNDQWVMNDSKCTASQKWTTANAATYLNDATAICINVKTFVTTAGQSLTTRYTKTCADSTKADIQTAGTNLANFITNYQEQVDRMLGTVGTIGLSDTNQAGAVGD